MCATVRGRNRRRHQPVDDAAAPRGYRLVGDVAFERGRAENGRDYSGARRRRSDDDRHVDGKYGQSRTTFFVNFRSIHCWLGTTANRLLVRRGCSTAVRASQLIQSRPA